MEINRNFKIGAFIAMAFIAYVVYTWPAKLAICMIPDEAEMMDVSIDIYKDGFSQHNQQTAFITERKKIESVLDFLSRYEFRKKIHNPHQPVGAAQKDTISIIFHYKDRNDVFDIEIFEIGNEGKIRIVRSVHEDYVPYTMGWIGKKQEKDLHKDLSEMLNNLLENDFEYKNQ